ncbi:MAG: hypothetical protein DI534_09155 [Leifsonia xyli]|nr:MAG: hypothetical protein DI534_09155 [Leifsonia xyli]
MKHRIRSAVTLLASVALVGLGVGPAFAAPDTDLEAEVAAILAAYPGGTELQPGVISWDDGATVLTLEGAAVSQRDVASCRTGQYCAWSNTSYIGTKLTFTGCSVGGYPSSLALLGGLARSTANARSSGHVDAVAGVSTIYSMPANSGNPANGVTLTALVCYT